MPKLSDSLRRRSVWILNHYAIPPGVPGGTRHYNFAKHLPAFGWEASVVAASVEHMSGTQRLRDFEDFRLETIGGVPFLWLRTSSYRGNGGARLRNMLEYAVRALLPASTRSLSTPDAVVGSSVHPFAAMAGALLAWRFSIPFVFEVRDLWPQTLIDMGRIAETSFTARAMRMLEKWLCRRADRIITLLPKAADYIARYDVARERVVWIPNGVDISAFPDFGPRQRGRNDVFTLMYIGSHGHANGLETLLHAMRRLQDELGPTGVRLRMIGDGPAKPALQELAGELGLDNVCFELPVPKERVAALMSEADAFVLMVLDRPDLYRYGISMNKMYDYLAGRRPILLASAAVNNPIEEAGAGLTVSPEDPAALSGAVKKLMALPQSERERMGNAGRHYAEQHCDFRMLAAKLGRVLDACVGEQRHRKGNVTG